MLVRLPKAPTPDHQILMVFDGFGGFGLCFCGFGGFGRCWSGSPGTPCHQILVVFDGFGGLVVFCLVLFVVLAVAGRAPLGTPYHQILMVFGGLAGFGCCW